MTVAVRALIIGMLSHVMPRYRSAQHHPHGARYFYSVFLRHLVALHEVGITPRRGVVAELGPGNALGVGLAALLAGWERYEALDVARFASGSDNLTVLDDLVELFRRRAPIPDDAEMPAVYPKLRDYGFPHALIPDDVLTKGLAKVEEIRRSLKEGGGHIVYRAPWQDSSVIAVNSVDWVLSQAVFEHVADPELAWSSVALWLRPGGVTSHSIDYSSHAFAVEWNGHWGCSDLMWRAVVGQRIYSLNRAPHAWHLAYAKAVGLEVLHTIAVYRDDGITRAELAARFKSMSDADLRTTGSFVVACKPG